MPRSATVAASGLRGYVESALATEPTYFWPLQGETDRTDLVSGKTLSVVGSAYASLSGPGVEANDACWYTDTGYMTLAESTINSNENTGEYSMAGWFYKRSGYSGNSVGYISNWNGNGSMLYGTNTTMYMYHNSTWVQANSFTFTDATWVHLAQTYDYTGGLGTVRLYKDGALFSSSSSFGGPPLGSNTYFQIGGYGGSHSQPLPGGAAYCGWWVGKALSLSEVQTLAGVA